MTKEEYILERFEMKFSIKKENLAAKMQRLSEELAKEAKNLIKEDNLNYVTVNSLGVIQFSGIEIDRMCGELHTLYEVISSFREVKNV